MSNDFGHKNCCCCIVNFVDTPPLLLPWASCQIRKIVGCACVGNAGNVSPPPRVSDPGMHDGTCVTHVQSCMPGSLNRGFLCRWPGKRSQHSRLMRNRQFYVSGKRPINTLERAVANSLCLPSWQTMMFTIKSLRYKVSPRLFSQTLVVENCNQSKYWYFYN